jgi:hypothetical protein
MRIEGTMLLQRLDRWRRRLDLDRFLPKRDVLDCHLSELIGVLDRGPSHGAVQRLLGYVLLKAIADRAIGVHFFFDTDDDCLRNLYCLAVDPAWGDGKVFPGEGMMFPADIPCEEWESGRTELEGFKIVTPDRGNPGYARYWFEMVPPPPQVAPRLFKLLRWRAGLRGAATEGELLLRYRGKDVSASVVAPHADDVRIFFSRERPPIRPKLARQFAEVGVAAGVIQHQAILRTILPLTLG